MVHKVHKEFDHLSDLPKIQPRRTSRPASWPPRERGGSPGVRVSILPSASSCLLVYSPPLCDRPFLKHDPLPADDDLFKGNSLIGQRDGLSHEHGELRAAGQHSPRQAPRPSQYVSAISFAFPSIIRMAPSAQAVAHSPQPEQRPSSISMIFLRIFIGFLLLPNSLHAEAPAQVFRPFR